VDGSKQDAMLKLYREDQKKRNKNKKTKWVPELAKKTMMGVKKYKNKVPNFIPQPVEHKH
jgi:hypothetical protein